MNVLELDNVLDQLRVALISDDLSAARNIIESLHPADQADLLVELDNENQVALLSEMAPADSADILEEMEDNDAAELAATLPLQTLVPIVEAMEPDEAADLLGDIHPQQAQDVLTKLKDAGEVRPLLSHSDDTAGGLMTTQFLSLAMSMTAAEAIQAIRESEPDGDDFYAIYVTEKDHKLCGVVDLQRIIMAEPSSFLSVIMNPEVIYVSTDADQEICAQLMGRYSLISLPVVDADGVMVGVIYVDDIFEVVEDEATEDIQRLGGTQPLATPYLSTSIGTIFQKRVGWLLMLFLTATLTGSVMRLFESELQTVVALSFFIPLLIGTGGNAGSQTTSTVIRAVAVGDVAWKDIGRSLWHEMRIGLLLGAGMAVAAYIRAITWDSSPQLALTVSFSIFTIVVWAAGLGSILPLLATRLGIDPTVVSGPVMSTLVDATGLFIYFTIARVMLGI